MFDVSNTDKFFKLYNGLTPNTTDEEREQATEQYQRSRNYIRMFTNFAPVEATTSFIESINKNSYIMLNMAVDLSIDGFNIAVEMYVHKDEVTRIMALNKDNSNIKFIEMSNKQTETVDVINDADLGNICWKELMQLVAPSPLRN